MLFDSSLRKELGRSFGATLVVLVTIVMTVMLIRTLGQASRGSVNPSEVMLILVLTMLGHLPTLLTLCLFIAITATLTRMYSASEMVVWFASGQGLLAFLRPMLRFAAPVLLAVAVLVFFVWPWTNQQARELRDRYQGRGDIERVAPGRFIESAGGQRVFFIDKDRADARTGRNIFIAATERGKETVTSAQNGRLDVIKGDRFIILDKGQRLETDLATGQSRVSEFAEYGNRIGEAGAARNASNSPSTKPTAVLALDPTRENLGELSWRLGQMLAAINCVLIALASTRVNPRGGRSAGLVFALFTFVTYYNLITFGERWVSSGRIGLPALLLLLHGGIFGLSMGWLLARHSGWLRGRRWRAVQRGAAA